MWSEHYPDLQIVWDATSLRKLQECPRKYQLGIVEGWRAREEREDLTFGKLFQEAVERFQLSRLRGLPLEEAGLDAMTYLAQASGEYLETYNVEEMEADETRTFTFQPFAGHYTTEWRCTGTEPYKNEKGNKAKCPYSHKGKWFPTEGFVGGVICGECCSPIEEEERWHPEHPTKNRETLLRTFLAFWDAQEEEKGLQPFAFPDGTPAVELQVVVPMGRKAGPEDYLLVANIDEINVWRGRTYPTDNKTTKNTLNDRFFEGFSPDTQFDLYDLISTLMPGLDPGGVCVRGVQVTATRNDVKTALITKTDGQREELWRELHWWVGQAERFAAEGYWPMNRSHCKMCDFRAICDMDPSMREQHLAQNFHRRHWDPIKREAEMPQTQKKHVSTLEHNVPSAQMDATDENGGTK